MGGNGSRTAYLSNTLAQYSGVRFNTIGTLNGIEIITVENQGSTKFQWRLLSLLCIISQILEPD